MRKVVRVVRLSKADKARRAANAERQRRFRQRHLHSRDCDSERLDLVISIHAKRQLERLAAHHRVTQLEMLERLVKDAEGDVLDGLDRKGRKAYHGE